MKTSWLVLLAACGLDGDSRLLAESVQSAEVRMHARFAAAKAIEQSIVTGNLAQVRAQAHSIATLDEPDALPEWTPYLEGVRRSARTLESAEDVVVAAGDAAALARECARCHTAIGAKPAFSASPRPDGGKRLQHTMTAHHWAAARMWEGVIGPNDQRWKSGAELLASAPLTITAESSILGIADDVSRIHLLATRAQKLGAQDDRVELFGRLLATCAHCHATIRDR